VLNLCLTRYSHLNVLIYKPESTLSTKRGFLHLYHKKLRSSQSGLVMFSVSTQNRFWDFYCQCHSPVTPAVVLAFFIFFPHLPLSQSQGTHPYLLIFIIPSQLCISCRFICSSYLSTHKFFSEAIVYSCTEQHCLFSPPIKAIWFVSQGQFLQSKINVWVLEQGCFLFGLDPIKSCLAP